jgi:hypothetical protein
LDGLIQYAFHNDRRCCDTPRPNRVAAFTWQFKQLHLVDISGIVSRGLMHWIQQRLIDDVDDELAGLAVIDTIAD